MGFLAVLPLPLVNTLVAGVVMMCVYPSAARTGPPQAVANARNAANWGLTIFAVTVAITSYMLAIGMAGLTKSFFPVGWGVIAYIVVCIAHLGVTIAGTAVSRKRVFRSVLAIPFFRRPAVGSAERLVKTPDVRAALPDRQRVEQEVLEEAAARRAQGERVKALRGATDGVLRIYTRAEAGPAWSESSSTRAVYAVSGLVALFGIISAILIILIIAAVGFGSDGAGQFAVGFVIVGFVWAVSATVLGRALRAKHLRRKRGLPDPIQGSAHLGPITFR
jgi:hypothetical protein